MKIINMAAAVLLALGIGVGLPEIAGAQTDADKAYADICQRVQKGKGDVKEADVESMLSMAKELAQPFAAEAAVKSYLASHTSVSSSLLQQMAGNALLAGDYRAAAVRL